MKKSLALLALMAITAGTACQKDKTEPQPETTPAYTVLSGDISENQTLDASKKYLIKGFVYVKAGATLRIPAGTVLLGDKATKGTLIVTRGARIEAAGAPDKPIVFTSAQAPGARREGDWGGIILLGKAPVNPAGGSAKIEGGLIPTNGGSEQDYIYYGGTDANDNSGTLKYVRIEFAGVAYTPDNEINALTMGGVGAGTTISHVQVYRSGDDAFEWFGGTVNCDHLVATYTWDDDFDTDFGYSGNVQFGLVQRAATIADQSGSNGFESDNDGNGSASTPLTRARFSNITIVGPVKTANAPGSPLSGINANYQHAAQIRRNSSQSICNSILTGFPVGLYIDDSKGQPSSLHATSGALMFRNNIIAGCAQPFKAAPAWSESAAWFAATGTLVLDSAQHIAMEDPYKFSPVISGNAGTPGFLLKSGSPALSGADFTGLTGFEPVPYRGAFDGANDWTLGWTTWYAEDTAY